MRVLGWLGTILCAPFYFLFFAMDKLKMNYWIPVISGISFVYLFFVGIKANTEGISIRDANGMIDIVKVIAMMFVILFIIVAIYILCMIWTVISAANHILCTVLVFALLPFVYGFAYCNAWRQGMSKCELEGKLAYIQYEKEVRKQEIKSRQEAKRAEKERKKQEQYAKGYQKQQAKRAGSQQNGEQQDYGYEDSYTGQQYQSGNYQSADTAYVSALSLFMLEEGYTMDELKKQRNRLMKSFHPDEDDAETVRYAQKINCAYEILKNRACA